MPTDSPASPLPVVIRQRHIALLRWQARAPRLAVFALVGLLALIGLRAVLTGTPGTLPRLRPAPAPRREADPGGFAEAFVRSYLTYDSAHQDAHASALRPFLVGDVDPDAGISPDPNSSSRVLWTAVAGETRNGPAHTLVTVATALSGQGSLTYVAVPIARKGPDGLVVDRYPALVGAPRVASGYQPPTESDISDPALAAVVKRALANYIAGATDNLHADLDRGATATPPPQRLELEGIDSITQAGPDRVAAQLVARSPRGDTYTLRYELAVVKRDRWYVRGLNPAVATAAEEGAN